MLDSSPISGKRRASTDAYIDDGRRPIVTASKPSLLPQPASAPSSRRLQRRSSLGRPFSSSSDLRGDSRTMGSTSIGKSQRKEIADHTQHLAFGGNRDSFSRSSAFEFKGSENNPSWLKRMSTLSSLKTGNLVQRSQPGTPSIPALSNSQEFAASIRPKFTEPGPGTPTPNKLVKRSLSHRTLEGSNRSYSTLRRPATSHQRSAAFRRHNIEDSSSIHGPSLSSPLQINLPADHQSYDDASQNWRPFFRSQSGTTKKDLALRKHGISGSMIKDDPTKAARSDVGELPTLLLATSINDQPADDAVQGRSQTSSPLGRPSTPSINRDFEIAAAANSKPEDTRHSEPRPRTSISVSEIFPSPSPLKWRLPNSKILRSKKSFASAQGGRRIASAPQSTQARNIATSSQDPKSLENPVHIARSDIGPPASSGIDRGMDDTFQKQSASPLPSLNRLSAFEINLPDSTPSYPNSLFSQELTTSQDLVNTSSSPLSSSPIEHVITRNQSHRPSGAPSDHASTLFGSDNDNSRLMSSDEDDMDGRSDTVYDSTRTGATSNSLSYLKRPAIDTIFDESPPPEKHTIEKWRPSSSMLEKGLHDIYDYPNDVHDGERDSSTPVQIMAPFQENGTNSPLRELNLDLIPGGADSPSSIEYLEARGQDGLLAGIASDHYNKSRQFQTTESPQQNPIAPSTTVSTEDVGLLPSSPPEMHSWRSESPLSASNRKSSLANAFDWSEHSAMERSSPQGDSPRPKTVHGRQGKETRGNWLNGRRGSSALHLRSQSVPVPKENRIATSSSKVDSWILGNKGPSEDWDGDFDFEEPLRAMKQTSINDTSRSCFSSGMLVPRAILERQASVHGQFGQVKELTLLVEELIRLQQTAIFHGITKGQSAELWKEAEGIINLAIEDDEEQKALAPHSSQSPSADFDFSDDESPSQRSRQWSGILSSKNDHASTIVDLASSQSFSRSQQETSRLETPSPSARPRKESAAKAKSVLEQIHQQRSQYDPALLDSKVTQKKLPFDTTSLKDLVTRAGVVTRALKEEVRRAESKGQTLSMTSNQPSSAPPDPAYTQMFTEPPSLPSPGLSRSPRVTPSPKSPNKSPKSQKSSPFIGASMSSNDNEINGHMKMMAVV